MTRFFNIARKALWILLLFGSTGIAIGASVNLDFGIFQKTDVNNPTSPGGLVSNFYNIGLAIGGILALGAIVYGAIKYTVSAGNPTAQKDAREWITQALWGLGLLAGSYLILQTINPKIIIDIGAYRTCPKGQISPHFVFKAGASQTSGVGKECVLVPSCGVSTCGAGAKGTVGPSP